MSRSVAYGKSAQYRAPAARARSPARGAAHGAAPIGISLAGPVVP